MKVGNQNHFTAINKQATSLYSLISDGQYRVTSLHRDTWKKLIGSQSSVLHNCNKEGFNASGSKKGSSKERIGFLGNNENHCVTRDSKIGSGTRGYHDDTNTCGNEATWSPDNGNKHIKRYGLHSGALIRRAKRNVSGKLVQGHRN